MTTTPHTRPESPPDTETAGRSSLDQNLSDSERPVREQLKKTTIAAKPEGHVDIGSHQASPEGSSDEGRGRPKKKRSHADFEENTDANESRKRSRDTNMNSQEVAPISHKAAGEDPVEDVEQNGTLEKAGPLSRENKEKGSRGATPEKEAAEVDMKDAVRSPKNKRDRETYEEREELIKAEVNGKVEEPSAKRTRDGKDVSPTGEEMLKAGAHKAASHKIPPGSAFANTSTASPFGGLAGSKSASGTASPPPAEAQTSSDAFKASGFGKFASSTASPFGTASGSASPFGGFGESKPLGTFGSAFSTKPSSTADSTFGPPLPKPVSSFGDAKTAASPWSLGSGSGSAFGAGLGGGLGSLGGKPLSTFASPSSTTLPPITGLSSKPAKPFGQPQENDDEDDKEAEEGDEAPEAGIKSPELGESSESHRDERFHKQHIESGEENEETIFSGRAKCYNFIAASKEWKERGLGVFKLNVSKEYFEEGKEAKRKAARFVMRADGSHRVILNTRVSKEMQVGDAKGERPKDKLFSFLGSLDGQKLELLQIKMKQGLPQELYDHVKDLQEEL